MEIILCAFAFLYVTRTIAAFALSFLGARTAAILNTEIMWVVVLVLFF